LLLPFTNTAQRRLSRCRQTFVVKFSTFLQFNSLQIQFIVIYMNE